MSSDSPPVPAGSLLGGGSGSCGSLWWATGDTETSVPADRMVPVAPDVLHPEVPHRFSEESEIVQLQPCVLRWAVTQHSRQEK